MWWTGELCRAWQQGWTPSFHQENGSKDKEQVNKGKQVHKLKLKWTEYKTKFIIRAETPSDSNITKTWENNRSTSVRQSQEVVQVSPPPASSLVYFLEEIFSFQFSFLVLCYIALQTNLHINIIHFMKDVCRFVVIAAVRAPESNQMDASAL